MFVGISLHPKPIGSPSTERLEDFLPSHQLHLPGSSRSKRVEVFSKDGWLGSALRWRFQSVALERKVLFVHAGLLPSFSQAIGALSWSHNVSRVKPLNYRVDGCITGWMR